MFCLAASATDVADGAFGADSAGLEDSRTTRFLRDCDCCARVDFCFCLRMDVVPPPQVGIHFLPSKFSLAVKTDESGHARNR